jgi:hypothetical protein
MAIGELELKTIAPAPPPPCKLNGTSPRNEAARANNIICSDWLKFQRSSSLKLMNCLNPNCKGMIIEMSFTKLLVVSEKKHFETFFP